MKRVSIVWLILVFIAGAAGFAISKTHNRPRVPVNAPVLELFLKGPIPTDTTQSTDCNNDGNPDTNWDILHCRFNHYKDVKKSPSETEDWLIWDKDPRTLQNKAAKVHYNTVTDEIVIFCARRRCLAE